MQYSAVPWDLPGSWYENSDEVADCHGQEHAVGGGLHALPAQDDDDDGVGDHGDDGEDGHDEP